MSDDEWTPADEERDKLDRLDEAKADAKSLKKELNLAKSAAKTLLLTTKPNTSRSYDSDESSLETVNTKYTHYDFGKTDEFNRENYKKYKREPNQNWDHYNFKKDGSKNFSS